MARRFTLLPPDDPFATVSRAYAVHRHEHGAACDAYAISHEKALFLSALAAGAGRVLEVGTALGYSSLWLARGVGSSGSVDTVERDAAHARLARQHFAKHAEGRRIRLHVGEAENVVPGLEDGYGLIFLDVDWHTSTMLWPEIMRLVRPGGFICLSNVWVADSSDGRSRQRERQAARSLIRRLQDDPTLSYSLVTAGSPIILTGKRSVEASLDGAGLPAYREAHTSAAGVAGQGRSS